MHAETLPDTFDVIVIGGSYAGLSASLQLGRARQRVLVIDVRIATDTSSTRAASACCR